MSNQYKSRVTLTFDNPAEKRKFLGQLCDGWGENVVNVDWPEDVDLHDAEEIHVTNWEEE